MPGIFFNGSRSSESPVAAFVDVAIAITEQQKMPNIKHWTAEPLPLKKTTTVRSSCNLQDEEAVTSTQAFLQLSNFGNAGLFVQIHDQLVPKWFRAFRFPKAAGTVSRFDAFTLERRQLETCRQRPRLEECSTTSSSLKL